VPAGTIRTQVVWGIVGIPYLVQQGLVHIGQAPLALEPAKLKLSPGVVAMLRVSLNAPAPAGGTLIDVSSSVPSVASAVTRVTVPEGQTSADLEVQASSLGTTKITVSHATLGMAETDIEVTNLPSLGLVPVNATVGSNQKLFMTLSLPTPAVSNVAVQLDNADAASLWAPSQLEVAAGQQSVSFEVKGLVDGISRLTAQADGYNSAWSTVNVRSKALVLPTSVVVAPTGNRTVTLETTEPAPAAGLNVSLALAQSNLAQIPAAVIIPPGQSSVSFTIQGINSGSTSLVASAAGYQSAQTALRVDEIRLNTAPLGDLVMNVNASRTVRVHIDKVAPKDGIVVGVVSQDPAVASVSPVQVFIPAGHTYTTVPITINALAEGKTAIAISSPGLISKTLNVHVQEKFGLRVGRVDGSKVVVGKGLYSYYRDEVYVERLTNGIGSSEPEAMTVHLRCAADSLCQTPETVTIPAGESTAYFSVTGLEVGSTHLEATAEGATAAVPFPVDVVIPLFEIANLDYERTTSSEKDDFLIWVRVPDARNQFSQYASNPLTVNVRITDQDPEGIVNGIYDVAGNPVSQVTIPMGRALSGPAYVAQPIAAGTYQISAEIKDLVSVKSWVQRVTAGPNRLELTATGGGRAVVGKYLSTLPGDLFVERFTDDEVDSGADALTVNLRCVNESICSVPPTVTIPAGQSYAHVSITGVDLGSTQIVATAAGFDTSILTVEVVSAVLQLHGTSPSIDVGQAHEAIYVSAQVPGRENFLRQTPATPISIAFSSSEPSVAAVTETVIWYRGNWFSRSPTFTAISPGTTQITASSPGFVPATSGVITVNP